MTDVTGEKKNTAAASPTGGAAKGARTGGRRGRPAKPKAAEGAVPAKKPSAGTGRKPASPARAAQPAKNGARGRKPAAGQERAAAESTAASVAMAPAASAGKPQAQSRGRRGRPKAPVTPIHLTMLGGMNEIGKNITLFEYGDDAFLIDCGMAFPDEEMLGVDIVLPDFTYVEKNRDRI